MTLSDISVNILRSGCSCVGLEAFVIQQLRHVSYLFFVAVTLPNISVVLPCRRDRRLSVNHTCLSHDHAHLDAP